MPSVPPPSPAEKLSDQQRLAAHRIIASMNNLEPDPANERPTRLGRGAPIRQAFTDLAEDSAPSPLARVLSSSTGGGGGRGGRTRLAVLLSLWWVIGSGDPTSRRPASFWARLLGLADPDATGAVAVRKALRDLEALGFLTLTRASDPDHPPTIRLLREDLSGRPYTTPTGREGDRYFRFPEAMWTLGKMSELSAPGLTMAVIAHRSRDTREDDVWFGRNTFTARYGLSDSTRKRGLENLVQTHVLRRHIGSIDLTGDVGHRRHRRAIYVFAADFDHPRHREPR